MSINLSPISQSNQITGIPANKQPKSRISFRGADSVQKVSEAADPKTVPAKMLLTLLKSALTGKEADSKIFVGRTYEDWVNMYNIAHENAVLPLALDGLKKTDGITVPNDVMENMEINTEFAKKYHSAQEKILKEFTEMTAANGIDTVQMKGIGFSMNYPAPQKRFGGDIDVYNFIHGTNPNNPGNNASFLVDELATKAGMELENHGPKHSQITHRSMPIENHRYFANEEIAPLLKKANKYLFKVLNPHEQILPHGTKILVPSKEFNNVFIPLHAMQHYVSMGINFHHLTDWAVQLQKNGLHIPEELKGTKFEEFTYAFTNLANKYLGTNVKVPENKKLENSIFTKMMHSDCLSDVLDKPDTKNPLKIVNFKIKRILYSHRMKKEYWGTEYSAPMVLAKSILEHLKNPKGILSVFTKMV